GQCTNPISNETFCCAHQAVTEFIEHVQILVALGFLTPTCGNSLIAFVLRAEALGLAGVQRFRDLELQLTMLSGGDTQSLQTTLNVLFAIQMSSDPTQRMVLLDLLLLTDPHLAPLSNCFIRLSCPEFVSIPVPGLPNPIFIGGGNGLTNPVCEEFR